MQQRIFLIIFCLFTSFGTVNAQSNSLARIQKVVIDPGHGGKDPGAISPDRKYYEKDITLSVALRLGSMIRVKYPNIEVIYTRKSDVFIPLDKRTEIANKNQADLFISIHVNSAKARQASGTETFVMGMDKSSSNLEVCKLENSVIVMEGDYSTKYEGFDPNVPDSYIIFSLLQNVHLEQSLILASMIQANLSSGPIRNNRGIKQGALLVLWKTTMPAVLTEIGFISNSNDLDVLSNKDAHVDFAYNLLRAFENYKVQYEKGYTPETLRKEANKVTLQMNQEDSQEIADIKTVPATPLATETKPDSSFMQKKETPVKAASNQQASMKQEGTSYRIQILAVSTKLKENSGEFKGIKNAAYVVVGGLYKYNIGNYSTIEQAKKDIVDIRKRFPQAFVIKVVNGVIVPIHN